MAPPSGWGTRTTGRGNSGLAAQPRIADSLCVSPNRHNGWLDWLRFLAALEVVLTHARTVMFVEYGELHSHNPAILAWVLATRLGSEAVIIFFVLSGYLVGGRAFSLSRQGKFQPMTYALDRTVRILVPLSAAILLTVAVILALHHPVDGWQMLGHLLSLQGVLVKVVDVDEPLWSLSYEVWFYIIGGAVAVMISRRRVLPVPAILVLLGAIVFTRLNPLYALLWIGGALCYFYRPARPSAAKIALASAVVLAGVAVFQGSLPHGTDEIGKPLGQVLGGAIILIGLMGLIPQLRSSGGGGQGLPSFLASFSYSLYLIHLPLLSLQPTKDARDINAATIGHYVATVLVIVLVAFLFSRCFETTAPTIKAFLRKAIQREPRLA